MGQGSGSGVPKEYICRTLAATLVLSTFLVGGPIFFARPALAQTSPQRAFSIPAGPLNQALAAFGRQSGLQVTYNPAIAADKRSTGASGQLTPGQAIVQILRGSGLSHSFPNAATVAISAPMAVGNLPEGTISLDQITIYGARDATTLGDTSASVGLVTAKDIEYGQIRTFRESFRRLGNIMDSGYVSSGFVIRGMSSEGFVPGGSPIASVYVDGILQPRVSIRRSPRSLSDTEQVEVYRGPQSTLSGRAVMAGAVYIKTKDPTFERKTEISGTVGNRNLLGTSFMVNTPLLDDQVALRVAGSYERSKTTVKYPTYRSFRNYDDFTTDTSYNLRAKLLITPRELPQTKALLSLAFAHDNPMERMIGATRAFGFRANRGDFFQLPSYAEIRPIRTHNAGLELTHDFTDSLRLTSLTGLHYGATNRKSVDVGTPGVANGIRGRIEDTLASQEVRLNYSGDRWKWVAGVYGSYQYIESAIRGQMFRVFRQEELSTRRTSNLAAFGEATYEFFPSWKITAGGRLDYLREKSFLSSARTAWGRVPNPSKHWADFNEYNFVPKLGLSKELAEGHTLGVSYSQGFRSGGYYFNYRTNQPNYYDPEKSRNYELFYKGRFLDSRLTFNANLFFTNYRDQQVEIRPDPNDLFYRETSNAASSRVWGFEIEPSWQVNEQLSMFASLGYLNTKFEKFDHASYGDLSGKTFPEAPKWTVGFGGRYEFLNGFYLGADAKYTASYLSSFGLPPQDQISPRVIVNAQVGYRKDNWEIKAFVENLLDERYYTSMDREAVPAYAQIGQPRSFGLTMKATF